MGLLSEYLHIILSLLQRHHELTHVVQYVLYYVTSCSVIITLHCLKEKSKDYLSTTVYTVVVHYFMNKSLLINISLLPRHQIFRVRPAALSKNRSAGLVWGRD